MDLDGLMVEIKSRTPPLRLLSDGLPPPHRQNAGPGFHSLQVSGRNGRGTEQHSHALKSCSTFRTAMPYPVLGIFAHLSPAKSMFIRDSQPAAGLYFLPPADPMGDIYQNAREGLGAYQLHAKISWGAAGRACRHVSPKQNLRAAHNKYGGMPDAVGGVTLGENYAANPIVQTVTASHVARAAVAV